MKKLVYILVLISVFGCTSQKTDEPVSIEDIVGNWECFNVSDEYHPAFNLYIEDKICHFGTRQDNRSHFYLKGETLVIQHADGSKNLMHVLKHSEKTLTMVMQSDYLIDNHTFKKGDTLVFHKRKQKNSLKVNQIIFVSNQCSDGHASFQLQIDQSKNVFYNGLTCAEKKGIHVGQIDPVFWKHLMAKIQYIDVKHLKAYANQNPADEQRVELIIQSTKGDYRCVVPLSNAAPATLRDLIEYIFCNYKHIDLKAIDDIDNTFKFDSSPRGKIVKVILEKIPC